MNFINLKNLTIEDYKEYHTRTLNLPDISKMGLRDIYRICNEKMATLIKADEKENCNYVIVFQSDDKKSTKNDAENFLVTVNTACAAFFSHFCLDKGRNRERRLGIPETFKNLNVSAGILKRAINSLTMIDNFNLIIKYKDLVFKLCD